MEAPVTVLTHDTELGQYKIGIWHDETPPDPRENDNLGTMTCAHRRYNLGDEQVSDQDEWLAGMAGVDWNDDQFENMEYKDIKKKMFSMVEEKYIILPLYLYDHSGITMSTGKFSCPWDSGQVGWIYYDRSRNEHEGYTPEWLEKYHKGKTIDEVITSVLIAEVKEYASYLEGDVYGYEIFRPDEEVKLGNGHDSCWGFFGYNEWKDNGLLDNAIPAIESDVRERIKTKHKQLESHFYKLKQWIKYKLPLQYRKQLQLNY